MTKLIIVRHGNTFNKGEIVTRVGGRTDLPLVESGVLQATKAGELLKSKNIKIEVVYAAPLKRTMQTAEGILRALGKDNLPIESLSDFTEIDYGVDENKPESEVLARLGEKALQDWSEKAIVPDGWNVNPEEIIQNWIRWSERISSSGKNTLIVSSNGIIRFAPYITGDFEKFSKEHDIKVSTGAICIFEYQSNILPGKWVYVDWNIK
ncbi:MAG: histidine phosphatase family protein [Deltaproteobacteria bacterium]|jgi:probable phosphoglycerate mutase|nr:histidine phosphatase family protein [Deltaproteobacteria bacterium]